MGQLVDGVWQAGTAGAAGEDGQFHREASTFRHWLTSDGQPGPQGQPGHPAVAGRYRLYVSLACPWAHRTLIMRGLKGLQSLLPVSVVHWYMGEQGWTFQPGPGVTPDPEQQAQYLHQIYTAAQPGMSGKVTVPVLWDRQQRSIVSNESADILRMLNAAFDGHGALPGDYYPEALRAQIDAVNARVYETVNNGVYKAGFASTQQAYDAAVGPLFDTLDALDAQLQQSPWLVGSRLTEADIRLFTTLLRFDAVYHGHFKCNVRQIAAYPGLQGLLQRMLSMPAIAGTVDAHHITHHYYQSHRQINPSGIVARGPQWLRALPPARV